MDEGKAGFIHKMLIKIIHSYYEHVVKLTIHFGVQLQINY